MIRSALGLAFGVQLAPFDVPVDPEAPQARDWIIRELAKPEYQAAKPTWFDQVSTAVWNWIRSLRLGTNDLTQAPVLAISIAVLLAAIITAYLIFGPPRLGRQSTTVGVLFGQSDERDSASMRLAAEKAAARGDFTVAIEEMFRAIARGLAERTIVSTSPGSTAHEFARRTAVAMPFAADAVLAAATAFDRVRYLGRDGTEITYRQTAALEQQLRAARSPHPVAEVAG